MYWNVSCTIALLVVKKMLHIMSSIIKETSQLAEKAYKDSAYTIVIAVMH